MMEVTKKVLVKVPAGVDNGSKLRLTGEGEASAGGGQKGDLYVFVRVEPHKLFKRDNTNVLCVVEISFVQAALGADITIPTLDGEQVLAVPKGTQYGETFKFKGQGIPSLRSGRRGDQIIQVDIRVPTRLTKKQEKLLQDFDKPNSKKISNRLRNLFKSI